MDLYRRVPADLTETTSLGGLFSILAGYVTDEHGKEGVLVLVGGLWLKGKDAHHSTI